MSRASLLAQHAALGQLLDARRRRRFIDALTDRQDADAVDERKRAGFLEVHGVRADADRRHDGTSARPRMHLRTGRWPWRSAPDRRSLRASSRTWRPWPGRRVRRGRTPGTASKNTPRFMALCSSGVSTQLRSCWMKSSSGLRPHGIAHHDVAGTGRKAEAFECGGEFGAKARKIGLRNGRCEQQPVVLIGAHRLLAAPFRSHDHQAPLLP